jgi:hypothetical protein
MLGKMPDASIAARCTHCGAGLALYMFSSRLMPKETVDELVAIKRGAPA